MKDEGHLDQVIRHCNGGMVTLGTHGFALETKFRACVSAFQDALYGPGLRLHNAQGSRGSASGKKNIGNFRCTVCGQGHGHCRPNP